MTSNWESVRLCCTREEDFLVHWFYMIARELQPRGTVAVLNEVVRFHAMAKDCPPFFANLTLQEIVLKLLQLKRQFENFRSFLNLRGIILDNRNDVVAAGIDFHFLIAYLDNPRYNCCQFRGVRNYTLLRFLFHNGCLNEVDYPWLLAAVTGVQDVVWFGDPQF